MHSDYMRQALAQARKAFALDEVPIGAVVVGPNGTIIGRGYNQVEKRQQQSAHAEVLAINKACKKLGTWRLLDCTIYVTLEPCVMCMGLITLSRFKAVIFGAPSPLFGYRLDKETLGKDTKLQVVEGVGAEQAVQLLQQFFKSKRKG